jgi:aryl-alcohol dehydrogenase-like predicted oxidoreductase
MLDNFDKADTLEFLWDGTGRTKAQAAIAGILANPAFATVLPTVLSLDDLHEFVGAVEHPLTVEERERVQDLWSQNFGVSNRFEMPLKSSR